MRPTRRAIALGAAALGAGGAWPNLARATSGERFTVTGKSGPFLRQVANRKLGWTPGQGGAMGLASNAINQGQYQQARLRMPQTEAAVRAMINRLRAQWPYALGPVPGIYILGVNYYNAYALPDNSIVVAFGLLNDAQSDDEVAFVLGHELSHLLLGHFATHSDAGGPLNASKLGQLYLVGSVLGGAASSIGGGVGAAANAAREAGATSDNLHFLTGVTAETPHTQAQEDEADALGFDLSLASAYSADDASAVVFDTIQADRVQRQADVSGLQAQLKTQLSEAVTHGVAQSFLSGGLSGGDLRQGLLAGGLRAALSAGGSHNEGPAHRPPVERKRGIAEYSEAAYPAGAPLRDEQHSWLGRLRATGEFTQAKIAVGAVHDAMAARAVANYPLASAKIAVAMATPFRSAPLVLCEAARLRQDMGDINGSEALFIQADASPDQTVDGCVDHARMLYQAGRAARAVAVMNAATSRFGDERPFLSLRIAVARQANMQDQADFYLQRCAGYNDDNLTQDCNLAAGKKAEKAKPKSSMPSLLGFPHF